MNNDRESDWRTIQEILTGWPAGELTPEHREMLARDNPQLLRRIEANDPATGSGVPDHGM